MARGTQAQKRRRIKRAAKQGVEKAQEALVAAAQGGDYPLGDRDEAWSASEAESSYDLPADAACYMWHENGAPTDEKASFKLPFVDKSGGKHAVWKAVTAVAGAVQGARGGVSIPADDKAGVKSKVEGYYAKAREKYDDENIKVPWATNSSETVTLSEMATRLSYAETGDSDDSLSVLAWVKVLADADGDDDGDTAPDAPNVGQCDTCSHMAASHAGAMNDGACAMEGCTCESFEPAEGSNAAETEELAPKKRIVRPTPVIPPNDEEKPGDSPDDAEPDDDEDDNSKKKAKRSSLDDALLMATEIAKEHGQRLRFQLTDFETDTPDDATPPESTIFTGGGRWVATLCPEGKATEDGRIFAPGGITWRELPLSLMGMIETQPGHDGAQVCGRIDQVWREEATGLIRGSGEFDPGEFGQEIARMVGDQTIRGISVDIAPVKVGLARRSEVVDEEGRWVEPVETEDDNAEEEVSLLDALFGDDDLITVVYEGVIGAATVCSFPAFADASIEIAGSLVASRQSENLWTVTSQAGWTVTPKLRPEHKLDDALTASAVGIAPVRPPSEWFDDPQLPELTPLTVTEEGRLFGHLAAWGTCHTGIPGTCTTAPTSDTDYSYFHLKEVCCEDGDRVACGTITMNTGHAELELGRAAATDHYDNTGVASADIRVGEDEHGIWLAGALRPEIDEVSARRLRGAALSGDWRAVRLSDGTVNRELIGVLAVNVPGFPVPRPAAMVASVGDTLEVVSQLGAGMHAGQEGLTRLEALLERRRQEAESMSEEFAEVSRSLAS